MAIAGVREYVVDRCCFEFSKQNGADWTLAANQDRITDKVWLTRASVAGLFNAFSETSYQSGSPADTEWALGSIADGIENLTFSNWAAAVSNNPPDAINKNFVLHLVADDIYIDLTFLSWQQGRVSPGGGFSYLRASAPAAVPLPAAIGLFGAGLLAFFRRRAELRCYVVYRFP